MEIHLLGTAGYHPTEDRHTACYMIPEAGVVLDAGTGFFRVRDLIQTAELHIFLSHSHLDHCIGLTFFIDVLHEKQVDNVYVYGELEKLNTVRQHLFSPLLFPVNPDFHWVELNTATVDLPGGGKLTPFPLKHPGGSLGFRLDWPNQSLGYVTDTTADSGADYVQQITGVNLLLHECHFADGQERMAELTGHSCLTPVANVSQLARVDRTMIIHHNPLADALDLSTVRHIFEPIEAGTDKMVVPIS